uniref:Pectinesterase inhibitor domain-containing protein n=1 Tax=Quercus lobata TaxID=97700 RepID=A0A7N2LK44_QUELO
MVFKDYTFFSYVFLATAVIFFTGQTHGVGLCDNSPNKQVCYSIVYTRTDPHNASVAACHKLVYETKVAKVVAQKQARSIEIDRCISDFIVAISNVKRALNGLEDGNYETLTRNINNTKLLYNDCDYVYENYGKINPIAKSTKHLKDIAIVGLYLASLL